MLSLIDSMRFILRDHEAGNDDHRAREHAASWSFHFLPMASLNLSHSKTRGTRHQSKIMQDTPALTRAIIRGGNFFVEQHQQFEAYQYHKATTGFFPRPCPRCMSNNFFVTADPQASPPAFGSRPIACAMCRRWHHTECSGIDLVEKVHSPWFCSTSCRRLFCELECWSNKGRISFDSPIGKIFYRLSTPSDHQAFIDSYDYHIPSASPLAPILSLLTRSFTKKGNSSCCDGINDLGGECDGGMYLLGMQDDQGNLTAAVSFSVYSTSLPAQVSLVAVEEKERRKGRSKVLFTVLEGALEELGIPALVMEPPSSDVTWSKKLGFRAMHPLDVARLHTEIPVSFIDAPIMEKWLSPRR
jgi:hypothetical protein